ncbi:MAG TPA: O-antigen ligase family protein [Vicinamibacteria bacterium]|nr:O-antigen ligase family protein [Vicinamibacteria bacterium]
MNRGARPEPLRDALRYTVLAAVAVAPWALGAVHPAAYVPLLCVAGAAGVLSWARAHWARAHGQAVPKVPGARWLLALHLLALVQLVPMPPGLLRFVSPGSFAHYDFVALGPLDSWRPVSVSPGDTSRALVFLAGMSLLYGLSFRDFATAAWRRRVTAVLVGSAALMAVEAMIQAQSAEPTRILGLYKPRWDWGVFGPYVNKNHFAGYLVLAFPLALAWAREALRDLRREWERRRVGWVALGDAVGARTIGRAALAFVLAAGLLFSRSRGGLLAVAFATLAAPLLLRRKRLAIASTVALAIATFVLYGLDALQPTAGRGMDHARFGLWRDALNMLPDFPLLGSGLNTFGTAYVGYRTVFAIGWFGEAHNDYLQALLDLGVPGFACAVALTWVLLGLAIRGAHSGAIALGLLGTVLASCAHALVDFNWQIPGNAATFALLAGLAVQEPPGREARSG